MSSKRSWFTKTHLLEKEAYMTLTQLSAWRMATEFEPKIPLRELRERKFDLHCGYGKTFSSAPSTTAYRSDKRLSFGQ